MGALLRFGRLILTGLSKLRGLILAVLGNANIQGWGIAIGVAAAYILIWKSIVKAGYDFIASAISGYTVEIFGPNSIPAGAMWLLNQTFPVELFFKLVVSLLIFRLTTSIGLAIAITASRKLK